jgi:hypothetical protein
VVCFLGKNFKLLYFIKTHFCSEINHYCVTRIQNPICTSESPTGSCKTKPQAACYLTEQEFQVKPMRAGLSFITACDWNFDAWRNPMRPPRIRWRIKSFQACLLCMIGCYLIVPGTGAHTGQRKAPALELLSARSRIGFRHVCEKMRWQCGWMAASVTFSTLLLLFFALLLTLGRIVPFRDSKKFQSAHVH